MPVRKKLAHKTLARTLLSCGKLTDGEKTAFTHMVEQFDQGEEPSEHQKLWIETLNDKYLMT